MHHAPQQNAGACVGFHGKNQGSLDGSSGEGPCGTLACIRHSELGAEGLQSCLKICVRSRRGRRDRGSDYTCKDKVQIVVFADVGGQCLCVCTCHLAVFTLSGKKLSKGGHTRQGQRRLTVWKACFFRVRRKGGKR